VGCFALIKQNGISVIFIDFRLMKAAQGEMVGYYHTAEVCTEDDTCLDSKQLQRIMAMDTDYETLLLAWKGFRDAVGPPMKDSYTEFVRYLDEGAKNNGECENE
jgi:peptidyl-dipeptidase A